MGVEGTEYYREWGTAMSKRQIRRSMEGEAREVRRNRGREQYTNILTLCYEPITQML